MVRRRRSSRGSVRGDREHGHDEDTLKDGEPGEQPAEVVAGGGEDGVGGVAVGSFEESCVPCGARTWRGR